MSIKYRFLVSAHEDGRIRLQNGIATASVSFPLSFYRMRRDFAKMVQMDEKDLVGVVLNLEHDLVKRDPNAVVEEANERRTAQKIRNIQLYYEDF